MRSHHDLNRGWARTCAAATVALLLATTFVAFASTDATADEDVRLTGRLTTDDAQGYVLTERESGDTIALQSKLDLSEHVGTDVEVTGQWIEGDEGEYFAVKKIVPAS